MTSPFPISVLAAALLAASLPAVQAAEKPPEKNLADLSIEELMNESVTSVSKREQKLGDVAAAITVLTNDDLRRSGATSIAEALRLVPGLDVASVNAREWAISARGFNGVFAKELLVLVDGRAAYDPLFAGVYWDLQQSMLEDVERIEVIRGPGATIWGANAVNGVINIVSKSARDTQGGLLYAGAGDVRQTMAGVRYGGQLGEKTYYRVFGGEQTTASHPFANGQSAGDHWRGWHGGFRLDHYADQDSQLTWQSEMSAVDFDHGNSDGSNINSLARWTREWSERSSVEVQAYYDRSYMNETARSRPLLQTYDLGAQQTFGVGERHDAVWGLGYRFTDSFIRATNPGIKVRNGDYRRQLFSAFVQDEFKLVPDKLALTAGIKLEHNDYTGFEIQPSARVVLKPAPHQTVWAAVARALRTPADLDTNDVQAITVGPPFVGPGGARYLPTIVGNASPRAEALIAYELGYRIQPTSRLSVELATFYNRYTDLIAVATGDIKRFLPGVPFGVAEMPFANSLSAQTWGGEVAVTVSATEAWRLSAGYSLLVAKFDGPPAANPTEGEEGSPRHQAFLRSSFDFSDRAACDATLRYTGWIAGAPSFLTADVRLSCRLTDRLEVSLVGQNLLDRQHPEQGPAPITTNSELPRSFYCKATWRF